MPRLQRWKRSPGAPPTLSDPRAELDLMRAATNHYTGTSAQGPRGPAAAGIPGTSSSHGDANEAFSAFMAILFRTLWRVLSLPVRLVARLVRATSR
jgi:hypothetical protein